MNRKIIELINKIRQHYLDRLESQTDEEFIVDLLTEKLVDTELKSAQSEEMAKEYFSKETGDKGLR